METPGGTRETPPAVELRATPRAGRGESPLERHIFIEKIGRGGRGRLLRAYDPRLQREVAVEVLRRDEVEDDAQRIRDVRSLAKLGHPHLIAIYDVEVTDDEIVIAMEYVRGRTLQKWIEASPRPPYETLAMFVQAGQGLLAAHRVGLLHGDVSPRSVLVGDDGRVRVTHFGSAARRSTPGLTRSDTTPLQAPERIRGEVPSPATDQYGFCASLWWCLVGAHAFDGADRERGDPPPWPESTAVPPGVAEAIRRGLAPKPGDRWPSLAELLPALRIEPRRGRRAWATAGVVASLAGVAGIAAGRYPTADHRCSGAEDQLSTTWNPTTAGAIRSMFGAVRGRYADVAVEHTVGELDAYAQRWIAMHRSACEATSIRGEQTTRMLDLQMACLHRARQGLQATVEVLTQADEQVVQNAVDVVAGLPALDRCADLEALEAAVPPPDPDEWAEVEAIEAALEQASALERAGKYDQAKAVSEPTLAKAEHLRYAPTRAHAERVHGFVVRSTGDFTAAERHLRRGHAIAMLCGAWDQAEDAAGDLVLVVGDDLGRFEEGAAWADVALGLAQRAGRPRTAQAYVYNHLGMLRSEEGRYADAEALLQQAAAVRREAGESDSMGLAYLWNNLVDPLRRQGRFAEAVTLLEQSSDVIAKTYGPDHPKTLTLRANLAALLRDAGRFEEAEVELREVLVRTAEQVGPDHPSVAGVHLNLGLTLAARGVLDEAVGELERAIVLLEAAHGPTHSKVLLARSYRTGFHFLQGRHEEALAGYRALLPDARASLGMEHPTTANTLHNLGFIELSLGHLDEAEGNLRSAVAARTTIMGPGSPQTTMSRISLGSVLVAQSKYAEAMEVLEPVWALPNVGGVPPQDRAEAAFALGRALWMTGGDRARARELIEFARAEYATAGPNHGPAAAAVAQWIDTHD